MDLLLKMLRDAGAGLEGGVKTAASLASYPLAAGAAGLKGGLDYLGGKPAGQVVQDYDERMASPWPAGPYVAEDASSRDVTEKVGQGMEAVLGPVLRGAGAASDASLEASNRLPGPLGVGVGQFALPALMGALKTDMDLNVRPKGAKAPKVPGKAAATSDVASRLNPRAAAIARKLGVTPEEAMVMATSRARGSVGERALTPRFLREQGVIKPGERWLDYGAGSEAAHAKSFLDEGMDVTPYDKWVGKEGASPLLRPDALKGQPYDGAYLSNVLNVQPSEAAMASTLDEVAGSLRPGQRGYGNYPASPRNWAPEGDPVAAVMRMLNERFDNVRPVEGYGSNREPLFEFTARQRADDLASAAAKTEGDMPGKPAKAPPVKDMLPYFEGLGLEGAEDAALRGEHLRAPPKGQAGTFSGFDPGITSMDDVEALRARRLAQKEQGGHYAGWYIDEGTQPPSDYPGTGFKGGSLYRGNPEFPGGQEFSVHSPKSSPFTNTVLREAVQQGSRQPGWAPEQIVSFLEEQGDLPKKKRTDAPKSVKPGMPAQTEKHARIMAGEEVPMGLKEGSFVGNLGGEPVRSTIDRHEVRTMLKDPLTPAMLADESIGETSVTPGVHAATNGENLVLNRRMKEKAAADPNYLKSIGWPTFPDGTPYPIEPRQGQAAGWLTQKSSTEFPDLFARDPKASMAKTVAEGSGPMADALNRMATTTDIPEGFDWRRKAGELEGYDPFYLQRNTTQWPEKSPSAPNRAHPVGVTTGQNPKTMLEKGITPASQRFIHNRELGRSLYQGQGDEATSTIHHGDSTYRESIPLSQEGKGTGTRAWLDRLSPLEKDELGADVFRPAAELPPESEAGANTRKHLQSGGVRGLEHEWKRAGGAGLLGLAALLGLPQDASAADGMPTPEEMAARKADRDERARREATVKAWSEEAIRPPPAPPPAPAPKAQAPVEEQGMLAGLRALLSGSSRRQKMLDAASKE